MVELCSNIEGWGETGLVERSGQLDMFGPFAATILGEVVQDDPQGFVLPDAMIDLFAQQDEIFWRMP